MNEHEQTHSTDEFDYNREPPLDYDVARQNRNRSKYVFMTLCFLLSLVLLYTYFNGNFANVNSNNWFPLIAAIVLAIMGVVFLRSPDSPPVEQSTQPQSPVDLPESEDMPFSSFEELVQEALATIPAEFHEQMENVSVHVALQPDDDLLERVGVKAGYTLLGLYEGIPLTTYGRQQSSYPEVITIYQHTIEAYCQHDPEKIREKVRTTVLHEVAHHFGLGHEEMPIWIK